MKIKVGSVLQHKFTGLIGTVVTVESGRRKDRYVRVQFKDGLDAVLACDLVEPETRWSRGS